MFEDNQAFSPIFKYSGLTATTGDSMSLPSTLVHGAVAATVDVGTTLWNSLTPQSMEASTSDLLARIDNDALQVYNEHPDAVKAASFFGGMLLPIGVSMKAMGALRNGMKGANWFSTAGQTANMAEVEAAFKLAGKGPTFLAAQNKLYTGVALNAVADTVVAEAAIVGTMSAHPYMDDYYKDFGKNFAISVAFGGILGTGIGAILKKSDIVTKLAPIEAEFNKIAVNATIKPLMEGKGALAHSGEEVAQDMAIIENLRDLTANAKNGAFGFHLEPYNMARIEDLALRMEGRLYEKLSAASKGEMQVFIENAKDADKRFLLDFASKVENAGADKYSWMVVKPDKVVGKEKGILQKTVDLVRYSLNKDGTKEVVEKVNAYYSPVFKSYFGKAEDVLYGTVADLGGTVEDLVKRASKIKGQFARDDIGIELLGMHAARADREFATAVAYTEGMKAEALSKLSVAYDDLPLLKAAMLRASRLTSEELDSFSITIREGSKSLTIDTPIALQELVQLSTNNTIKEMAGKGFGFEAISIRTGTPLDTVHQIIEGSHITGTNLHRYKNLEDVKEALKVENRAIGISTSLSKIPNAEMFSKMNSMDLQQSSDGIVEYVLRTNKDEMVRGFAEKLFSQNNKSLYKGLEDLLGDINALQAKSTMFSSANQVLERMGAVGVLMTNIGKNTIHMRNEFKKAFEEPMANLMGTVAKNTVAQIEANVAININASLVGKRWYRDGQIWQFSNDSLAKDLLSLKEADFKALVNSIDPKTGQPLGHAAKMVDGTEFIIRDAGVKELFDHFQKSGRSLYELKNAKSKAIGQGPAADIGLWIPSTKVQGVETAYVFNTKTEVTTLLHANTPGELRELVASYKDKLFNEAGKDWEDVYKIIQKDQQALYNKAAGRHDPMFMEMADLSMRHGGSSSQAAVATDTSSFQAILNNYANYVNRGIDDVVEIQMAPTFRHLKNLSDQSQIGYNAEKAGRISNAINKPQDVGSISKNIILGYPNLTEHKTWGAFQEKTQIGMDIALEKISRIFGSLPGKTVRSSADWDKVLEQADAVGMTKVFDSLDREFMRGRYLLEGKGDMTGISKRAISLGNGLAATMLLKFMEVGQPLVNALSLPILTSAAVNRKLSASFLGTALDENAKFSVVAEMSDGIRLMNHPVEGKRILKIAEDAGWLKAELREVSEMMEIQKSLNVGLISKTQDLMESKLVNMLSGLSNYSEEMVRAVSFTTGISMARKAYPGLSETGQVAFARNFMDEAIGNYTSAQRPAMFQGTLGTAMGLFQTYMLTLAQAMYRQVEHRDWASLGKMLLTQQTIFGATSMPGFSVVSEAIGKNFSDQHIDLQTGTFRAINDTAANILLYGAPSNFGPGITTRGDIQPRIPNPISGIDSIPIVNLLKQAYQAGDRVASAAFTVDQNAGRALLEAISLQSISRPIARLSELATRTALTGSGDIVAQNEEIWNTQSVFSRIMSTRPLREIKARETMQLNSVYGQSDSEERKTVMKALKSGIRSGRLDNTEIDSLAETYLRNGHSRGWNSAVNEAIVQAGQPGNNTVRGKLDPESPLQRMISDI